MYAHVARAQVVPMLLVEASGSNQYEAKFRAYEDGARRLLLMFANKYDISIPDREMISYVDLKKAFVMSQIEEEVSTNNSYKAKITFKVVRHKLNELLVKYGGNSAAAKFYRYLVIPVIKRGNTILLDYSQNDLLRPWSTNQLFQHNSLLVTANQDTYFNHLQDKILSITYEEAVESMPDAMFAGVLLVVCESFVRTAGGTYIKVDMIKLKGDKKEIITKQYDVLHDVGDIINQIMESVIKTYGEARPIPPKSTNAHKDKASDNVRTVLMHIEAYHKDDIEFLIRELKSLRRVEHINIKTIGTNYKVEIATQLGDEDLAEELFMHNITYAIRDGDYSLMVLGRGP